MLNLKEMHNNANVKAFLHLIIAGTAVWKAMQYKRIAGATECLARIVEDHDKGVDEGVFNDFKHNGKHYRVRVNRNKNK